jgi:nitrate/nitrite transporter NarK
VRRSAPIWCWDSDRRGRRPAAGGLAHASDPHAPKDRVAQYFGLFALTGRVTSFVGPLLIGVITAVTESQKAGMAVLVVFFVAGLALLARVGKE